MKFPTVRDFFKAAQIGIGEAVKEKELKERAKQGKPKLRAVPTRKKNTKPNEELEVAL